MILQQKEERRSPTVSEQNLIRKAEPESTSALKLSEWDIYSQLCRFFPALKRLNSDDYDVSAKIKRTKLWLGEPDGALDSNQSSVDRRAPNRIRGGQCSNRFKMATQTTSGSERCVPLELGFVLKTLKVLLSCRSLHIVLLG
eukprot:s2531_g23.t1